jgi:hypothetical protein
MLVEKRLALPILKAGIDFLKGFECCSNEYEPGPGVTIFKKRNYESNFK